MKKNIFLFLFVTLGIQQIYADYNGTITVNSQSLSFEQKDGYNIIKLESYNFLTQPGAPRLPAKNFMYIIPFDKKVISISITNITEQNISGTFSIYPAQEAYIPDATPVFTQPNPAIYNTNTFWPNLCITMGGNHTMSGTKLISLMFCPVKYNPVTGEARLITSVTFTLTYAVTGTHLSGLINESPSMNGGDYGIRNV